jgi:gamma-glutamylcyclotransferase (GGCT)/AIG2-like uncharacterized protein YtfP
MDNLFTYGTLMCEEIMERVCGCRPAYVPGTLEGYERRAIREEPYPAIIAQAGECTAGRIYRGVPDAAWTYLDRYEGEMYRRVEVNVHSAAGQVLSAWTYLLRPEYRRCLAESGWDFNEFLRHAKGMYMKALESEC